MADSAHQKTDQEFAEMSDIQVDIAYTENNFMQYLLRFLLKALLVCLVGCLTVMLGNKQKNVLFYFFEQLN